VCGWIWEGVGGHLAYPPLSEYLGATVNMLIHYVPVCGPSMDGGKGGGGGVILRGLQTL